MEKVKRFFRELHEKRAYQIAFFIISMCLIVGIYELISTEISYNKDMTVVEDKNLVKFIEDVTITDGSLELSGWCFYDGADSKKYIVQVFLKNLKNEEDILELKVDTIVRDDVDTYFDCEVDYSRTGFVASEKLENLNLYGADYEILLALTYSKADKNKEREYTTTVSTERYLRKGELTAAKSTTVIESTSLEVLNEVLENGQLIACRDDYGMYIFQHGKKLYWIANDNFFFEKDGTTGIQYIIESSREDFLPKDRKENNWTFDNKGFYFEQKELEGNSNPYRVAVCEIPSQYPVKGVETGYYVEPNWIWREYLTLDIRSLY